MQAAGVSAVPPAAEAPRESRWRQRAVTAIFLGPAAFFLGVWLVYPTIKTIIRSFFDRDGSSFVWFDNYKELFTDDTLVTAIKNSAIWVGVVPALVTAIGLIFAVLTERVRWSVAFKTAVFMPMAISAFATGVIWRVTLEQDPDRGPVNAVIAAVKDVVDPPGVLARARPSTDDLKGSLKAGLVLDKPVRAGDQALLGLTAIPPKTIPEDAVDAV